MKTSKFRPSVVIWWGIGLTIVGALLVIFVPNLVTAIATGQSAIPSDLQGTIDVSARTIAMIFPNLGTVLIGAGIVMHYVDRKNSAPSQTDI
jgi:type II secretory pathway component PulF